MLAGDALTITFYGGAIPMALQARGTAREDGQPGSRAAGWRSDHSATVNRMQTCWDGSVLFDPNVW